jgi:phosphatidylglycerophosphate synthase
MSLQVLLLFPQDPIRVAGLPYVFRTAQRAAELKPAKVVWAETPAGFTEDWSRQLASFEDFPVICANGEAPSKHLTQGGPLLVISGGGTPRPEALRRFLDEARSSRTRVLWTSEGKTVAAYHPRPVILGENVSDLARSALAAEGSVVTARAGDWQPAGHRAFVEQAEKAIYSSLGKENDGFIARLDRRLSSAVSRLLIKTPVTPNQLTTASLLIGLCGSLLIATGVYGRQVAGALLLWSCCILDGCDGEVARLKLLCSKAGAAYDLTADNVAHLATFAGIAIGVYRARPDLALFWPGVALLSGVAASMFSVWWLILRRPNERRTSLELFVERLASRDYVYLVLILVLIGKLHWFLWAAAVGSHLFNAALLTLGSDPVVKQGPRSVGRRPLHRDRRPS